MQAAFGREEHPEVASARHNLGWVYFKQVIIFCLISAATYRSAQILSDTLTQGLGLSLGAGPL